MKTVTRIPAGGYGCKTGRVLTRSEVTTAVAAAAQRKGMSRFTIRAVTVLFREAMEYYGEKQDALAARK